MTQNYFMNEQLCKNIIRYLLDSKDNGIIFKLDISKVLECFVDADFTGRWKDGNHKSPESVLSRTDHVIMYAGCPLLWVRKLQSEIALSTTESKYIALSTAMREMIPFMGPVQGIANPFGLLTRRPVLHSLGG